MFVGLMRKINIANYLPTSKYTKNFYNKKRHHSGERVETERKREIDTEEER